MLRQVAEGVLIHESEFCQSNAVVVHGRAGVLLAVAGGFGLRRSRRTSAAVSAGAAAASAGAAVGSTASRE